MKQTLYLIADFLLAVFSCFVLASLFQSQFMLHGLTKLGIEWSNSRVDAKFQRISDVAIMGSFPRNLVSCTLCSTAPLHSF